MARKALGAWAILVYVFLYAPIAIVVLYAFNGGNEALTWEGFSTRWFGEALRDPSITEPFRNSLVIAGLNAMIACVLGTALALSVSRMRRSVRVPIDALVYMTLVTPEIVFGISALIFFVEIGVSLGLKTILISHVVFNASVVALIVRARFVGMGEELEEASYDLGAPRLSTFRQVTLPRLAPAIFAGGLLAFTFSFDDFITSFFAGATTLPIRIFSSVRFGTSPVINATAVMILGLTIVAIVAAYLVLRRTEQARREATAVVPGV